MDNEFTPQRLAEAFAEHRARLLSLVEKRLNPVLLKRMSHEDVLQEAYLAAAKRLGYFTGNPDVPVYFKLRTVLLQTMTDLERRNLQAARRDAYKELRVESGECRVDGSGLDGGVCIRELSADITSPLSRVDRNERHALLRGAIAALSDNDRAVIELRHFDGMGNSECAAALGIEPKAASIRYVRALERLQSILMELSCFKK